MPVNTIVLPTYNEMQNPFLPRILDSLANQSCEVLVIDGGSDDGTPERISEWSIKVVQMPNSNRAQRLNQGIAHANGAYVLLHHPRSIIDKGGLKAFCDLSDTKELVWGGFRHRFDHDHSLLMFTSWYSNEVRRRRGIVYLDHCIFAPRQWLIGVGGVPPVDIFEDTLLSEALRMRSRPILMPWFSTTSAVRFRKEGVWKRSLHNQILKLRYRLGHSIRDINRTYEKHLWLNSNGKD